MSSSSTARSSRSPISWWSVASGSSSVRRGLPMTDHAARDGGDALVSNLPQQLDDLLDSMVKHMSVEHELMPRALRFRSTRSEQGKRTLMRGGDVRGLIAGRTHEMPI